MAAPSQEYLKTKVMTASPEMLTLMLWDGAIRFAEQAKEAIRRKDIEGSFKALVRSQKIITELSTALNRNINPDLCGKLAALYNFIYRRLVEANITKDEKLVDDALEIMRHQRETWVMLMDKLAKEKAGESQPIIAANADAITSAAAAAPIPSPTAIPTNLPKVPAPAGAPARRGYPAFAVRPAAVAVSSGLSVQG
ncbi:MAG TPA: flagellar export chaperone FliS [Phycisphaerae bacterium]|nr:flagellar export chaperone FliS [Phycisphaerae bacterium]